MSSLKAKFLLLLKSIRFKGLQRFGTQFSTHRDFRSSVYRRKKCVSFLYSTQEQLHPSHQLIPHLFFICNTKISFTLLHNKNRKAHHSHVGLYLILKYTQILILQKRRRKIYLSLVFSRRKDIFYATVALHHTGRCKPSLFVPGVFGLQSSTLKGSQYI